MPLPARPTARAGRGMRPLSTALLGLEGALALSSAYLLGLLVAARDSIRNPPAGATLAERLPLRLAVLVPAHDEASGIGATLASLAGCDYPADARRIIVIADNCGD